MPTIRPVRPASSERENDNHQANRGKDKQETVEMMLLEARAGGITGGAVVDHDLTSCFQLNRDPPGLESTDHSSRSEHLSAQCLAVDDAGKVGHQQGAPMVLSGGGRECLPLIGHAAS